MQASELIVPSEGATCWENVTCTAQTRDHDCTRVYVPHMKVCMHVCMYVCVSVCMRACVCVLVTLYVYICFVSLCVCVCVSFCVYYCIYITTIQVEIKLIWLRADPNAVPIDATFIECMTGVYKPCFDKPYASTKINNYQFNSISAMMVMREIDVYCACVYPSVIHCLRLILITPLKN